MDYEVDCYLLFYGLFSEGLGRYPLYASMIATFGGHPCYYDLDEELGWRVSKGSSRNERANWKGILMCDEAVENLFDAVSSPKPCNPRVLNLLKAGRFLPG